jgi:RNA recognition motif-containing protein
VCTAYGVVVFKERGDGERAIDKLNGYLVGDNKLRVDWAYPFVPSGSNIFPFISMSRASRQREKCKIVPTTKTTAKRIFKKQPLLRGASNKLLG